MMFTRGDWCVEGASNSSIVTSFHPQRDYASYVTVQIENLTKGFTPDQYLASLMREDAADYKDFPDIRFTQNTTYNIILKGHPGYLPANGILHLVGHCSTGVFIPHVLHCST